MPAAVKDREIARQEGRIYYIGYKCKKCLNDQRYVSNGQCIECSKQKNSVQRQQAADRYAKSTKGRDQQRRSRVRHKERQRDASLQKMYGISLTEYNTMLSSQEHKCAICGKHQDSFSKRLFVDHCHTTGVVRGLLCHKCNSGLGHFEDNVYNMQKAIDYLKNGVIQ